LLTRHPPPYTPLTQKPQKLRHLLSEHAELGRLYLAPEDALGRRRRARAGGNSGLNFTEGWVEFADKAAARALAARLNGQPMGGRRRSAHYYDLWTMRYLPRFKWEHLTAELAAAKAEREQRLAAEASAAARERDFYLSRVERAKGVAAVVARRAGGGAGGGAGGADGEGGGGGGGARVLRTYGQRRAKADPEDDAAAPTLSAGVLALVAGRRG
jgi:ESF2/ABP1 family protein